MEYVRTISFGVNAGLFRCLSLDRPTQPDNRVHHQHGLDRQPSPLRLEYLGKVLDRYQSLYGEKLPTALWNIHLSAFKEVVCDSGAGTPPGAGSNGWSYEWPLWSDANLAAQHLRDMRQWMADRGERDKPLIITEFGQLMPDDGSWCYGTLEVCITPETSRTTLQNNVNYFLTLTDAQTGYPADGNRLAQMWAWFSRD
jgi:hypothetical protein